ADRGIDDFGNQPGTDVNTELGKQKTRQQRAGDADQDVADDAKAGAAHDLAGKPARDQADKQDDQNAFVGNLHRNPLVASLVASPATTLSAMTERGDSILVPA